MFSRICTYVIDFKLHRSYTVKSTILPRNIQVCWGYRCLVSSIKTDTKSRICLSATRYTSTVRLLQRVIQIIHICWRELRSYGIQNTHFFRRLTFQKTNIGTTENQQEFTLAPAVAAKLCFLFCYNDGIQQFALALDCCFCRDDGGCPR
jgi:hypothetical protein